MMKKKTLRRVFKYGMEAIRNAANWGAEAKIGAQLGAILSSSIAIPTAILAEKHHSLFFSMLKDGEFIAGSDRDFDPDLNTMNGVQVTSLNPNATFSNFENNFAQETNNTNAPNNSGEQIADPEGSTEASDTPPESAPTDAPQEPSGEPIAETFPEDIPETGGEEGAPESGPITTPPEKPPTLPPTETPSGESNFTPNAIADTINVSEDGITSFIASLGLLSNDSDANNHGFNITAINSSSAAVGSPTALSSGAVLTVNANGSLSYNSNGQFESLGVGASSSETFTYRITDAQGAAATATVTVVIQGVNDGPEKTDDTNSTNENTTLNIVAASGVLANDSDVDIGDTLTVSEINGMAANVGDAVILASGGIITVNSDGDYIYDPTASAIIDALVYGESLVESLSYTVADNNGGTDSGTLTITISGSNIDLSALNGISGMVFNGINSSDWAGFSAGNVGDINDDGFLDLGIGAFRKDSSAGEAYVYYGHASGHVSSFNLDDINGSNGVTITGFSNAEVGRAINGAGDLSGDGVDDLVVGAPRTHVNTSDDGAQVVVYGDSALGSTVDPSSVDGSDGFQFSGGGLNDYVGERIIAGNGDLNGDGLVDIAAGNPGEDGPGPYDVGDAYVLFNLEGANPGSDLLATEFDGDNGFVLNGRSGAFIFDRLGLDIEFINDLNHDGINDLIIANPGYDTSGNNNVGRTMVIYGKDSGFDALVESDELDGSDGFYLIGEDSGGEMRLTAGDFNGDGYEDIVIGKRNSDLGGTNTGTVYVVFGKTSGTFDTSVNLADLDGSDGFKLYGVDDDDLAGAEVSFIGDFNGDGIDDLAIGAPDANPNGDSSGEVYILFGSSDFNGGAATVEIADKATGSTGLTIEGLSEDDRLGETIAGGDFNGDGFGDILIGARFGDNNGADSGETYLIFGSGYTNDVDVAGTTGDDTLTSATMNDVIVAGAGDDVITASSSNHVVYAGAGDDNIVLSSFAHKNIDAGLGTDTITFSGGGLSLNLSTNGVALNLYEGVEIFDISGSGSNTLNLDNRGLFEHFDPDMLAIAGLGERLAVRVIGDSDDIVNLENDIATGLWSQQGTTTTIDSVDYNYYQHGSYGIGVLVQEDISVNLNTVPPVVLDLGNDGFEFRSLEDGILFDVDNDGVDEQMAWVGSSDAILAYDQNQDGLVHDINEISFRDYDDNAATDLEGLNHFDTNQDGMFDAQDAEFNLFHAWQDVNGNGTSEYGEVISLSDLGIKAISLQSDQQFYQDQDAYVFGESYFIYEDGSTGAVADVSFASTAAPDEIEIIGVSPSTEDSF